MLILFCCASFLSETCNAPVQVANTEPVGNSSYTLQSTFRMMCIKDYVRKAGTSNLFRCTTDEHTKNCSWKNYPALECIRKLSISYFS
uniref:Sushi domain-containing protein n=1 Tax=Electrophorus electricus TaxID=8005 RepID=A0A4W4EMJ6_ELEEL